MLKQTRKVSKQKSNEPLFQLATNAPMGDAWDNLSFDLSGIEQLHKSFSLNVICTCLPFRSVYGTEK